jgi:di/tricarboxylate transporter
VNPAVLSLIALLIAIALSMATKLNVGVAAMAFAWLIGTFAAGWKADQVAAGFPSSLFLTLTGVTLLFALAETNGTLDRLAHRALGLARGQARLLPVLLFVIAFALSSVGPGAITTVALLVPTAMLVATDQRGRNPGEHEDDRSRRREPPDEGVGRELRGPRAGDGRGVFRARRLEALVRGHHAVR